MSTTIEKLGAQIKGSLDTLHTSNDDLDCRIKAVEKSHEAQKKLFKHTHSIQTDAREDFDWEDGAKILTSLASNGPAIKYDYDGKAMGETVGSEGGFTVQSDVAPNLIVLVEEYGTFRRNVDTVPVYTDSTNYPKRSGVQTVSSTGENATIASSDLSISTVGLNCKKHSTLTYAGSELLEDSAVPLAGAVFDGAAHAIATFEDQAGFLGDGTSTYAGHVGITGALMGIDSGTPTNAAGLTLAAGNAYSEITLPNFETVCSTLPTYAYADPAWYMSPQFYWNVIVPLSITTGVANATELLSTTFNQRAFLGFPIRFTSAMPTTEANSQLCCILGDLKQGCLMGIRRDLTFDRSPDVAFASDQLAFRVTERIAISAHDVGDTSSAGAIVGLVTAAS